MKIYERIDKYGNMVGWIPTEENPTEVVQTHTLTYFQARRTLIKSLGMKMGLEDDKYFKEKYV